MSHAEAPTPQLMGIVNLTPDSFSDGGLADGVTAACTRIATLVADGAQLIDLGAESTRPRAEPLSAAQEWDRLAPVVEALLVRPALLGPARLSLDTRHPATAARVVAAAPGLLAMLNDVGGGVEPAMVDLARRHGLALVVMHHLGLPVDPARTLPEDADAILLLADWAAERRQTLTAAGLPPQHLWLDPGIGFGKRAAQSLALVAAAEAVMAGGGRWLWGVSRKSFMSRFTDRPAPDRDLESAVIGLRLARAGAGILRVHDVASQRRALVAARAVGLL